MYTRFLLMTLLSAISMYFTMFLMVDKTSNAYNNMNTFYMTFAMVSIMVFIEFLFMRSMYPDTKINMAIISLSIILLIISVTFTRKQVGIGNTQFLRSMIPHHAGALLMCDNNNITDLEIKQLCENIKTSQQTEIDWMKTKLKRLK